MDTIRAWQPDVFVGLGDMIYADNACESTGRYGNPQLGGVGIAVDLPSFWAHWRYNRGDSASQRLLAGTSYVGVWDDHEVVNDFGPLTDAPTTPPYSGAHLLPLGLEAFLDYTPIETAPTLYRSLRWGQHLELFVLDTRRYRDANFAPDTGAQPKSMLGAEQLAWLKEGLASSDATWKVIVSSVPMSIPTGFPPTNGRDGWADFDQTTGFERELLDILRFLQERGIDDSIWITTDVHFAEVFRYRPFADDPAFTVHELATGPLNAGIFPNRRLRHDAESRAALLLRARVGGRRDDVGGGEAVVQLRDAHRPRRRDVDRRSREHGRRERLLARARSIGSSEERGARRAPRSHSALASTTWSASTRSDRSATTRTRCPRDPC